MSSANTNHMEIEKKWMVEGFPFIDCPIEKEELMRQGYISVSPTVRIREEALIGGSTEYILCFKSAGLLSRKEIEFPITKEHFEELEDLIALPLIPKLRRTYLLPGGLRLEVNHVDEGLPTEFWYAEIEFESETQARSFDPACVGLENYLVDDVTEKPGQSMGAYWIQTRINDQR